MRFPRSTVDELKELASEAAAQAEEKQATLADLTAKLDAQEQRIVEQTAERNKRSAMPGCESRRAG